jgi:hypothetical protein
MENELDDCITVVIDNSMGDTYLDLCQASVKASSVGLDIEILIGTDPATVRGTKLLLRADCLIGEDLIRSLHYHLMEHPAVSEIGVKLIDNRGCFIQSSKQNNPTNWDSFCMKMGLSDRFPSVQCFNKRFQTKYGASKPQRVDILANDVRMLPTDSSSLDPYLYYLPFRALSLKHRPQKQSNSKDSSHKRMQLIAYDRSVEEVKQACTTAQVKAELFSVWSLNENRVLDAISRRNQMKKFTDIVFCYPDVRFEQLFLFMEQQPNKEIQYHIYNKNTNHFTSL